MDSITIKQDQAMPGDKQSLTTSKSPRGLPRLRKIEVPDWKQIPHPTAHLEVLRNPTHEDRLCDAYLSPGMNISETYVRFLKKTFFDHKARCTCANTKMHRFVTNVGESSKAFIERRLETRLAEKRRKRRHAMKDISKTADDMLEEELKTRDLSKHKWKEIMKELEAATWEHAQAKTGFAATADEECRKTLGLPEDKKADLEAESSNSDVHEPTGTPTGTKTIQQIRGSVDYYAPVFDDSSDEEDEDEDDFNNFYDYTGENATSNLVNSLPTPPPSDGRLTPVCEVQEIEMDPTATPPPSDGRLIPACEVTEIEVDRPATPPSVERIVTVPWKLSEFETYFKSILERNAEMQMGQEIQGLLRARFHFLAAVEPRKQNQLRQYPCSLTVIRANSKKLKDPVAAYESAIPIIRVTTPAGMHLEVDVEEHELRRDFDRYKRDRDQAQEPMQYKRECYFSGEPSIDFERRDEKENRLKCMQRFDKFMQEHKLPYPNLAHKMKSPRIHLAKASESLETIEEEPSTTNTTSQNFDVAFQKLQNAQARLATARRCEKEFKDVLIPAVKNVRAVITIQLEKKVKEDMELERFGWHEHPPMGENHVQPLTAGYLRFTFMQNIREEQQHPDPKDPLRLVSPSSQSEVRFVGHLKESKISREIITRLPNANDLAWDSGRLKPEMFEKPDIWKSVRKRSASERIKNMKRVWQTKSYI
jgi:hypothetical protein